MRICIQLLILILDRKDLCLYRCEPERQGAFRLLQNVSHETIQGTKDCSVKNNRSLLRSVTVNVGQVELRRQAEIQLAGRKCVLVADCRFYVDIQLRAVECRLADLLCILDADIV